MTYDKPTQIIDYDGVERWRLVDGNFHREDGHAVIHPDGFMIWYWHGKLLDCKTQEEFERLIKLKAFW